MTGPGSVLAQLEECQERLSKLSKCMEVARLIFSSLDLEVVLDRIMTTSREVMKADASSLMLLDEGRQELVFQVAQGSVGDTLREGFRLPLSQGIAGAVCRSGEAILVEDAYQDPRFHREFDDKTGYRTRSLLCVPLKINDRVIGVAEVINKLDGTPFTKEDLDTFATLCQHAAIAIENARIHNALLRKERIERDLALARAVQQRFLPEGVPKVQGFLLASYYQAALEVGGDFFDFVPLGNGRWGIIIGDVSGKGVSSALYMARVTSDLRMLAMRRRAPSRVMEQLNKDLCERSQNGTFATILYLVIKEGSPLIRFVNAGHIPPYIWRKDTGLLQPASVLGDPPAGILRERTFRTRSFRIKDGDYLLLVTDGLLEARNTCGQSFGWEGVRKALNSAPDDPQGVVEILARELQEFSGRGPQADDVTLVVLKASTT